MGRRVTVTNLALGPRGWPEIGKTEPTILRRGETETLVVADNIFETLQRMASGAKPEVELEDLGEVEDKKPLSADQASFTALRSSAGKPAAQGGEQTVTLAAQVQGAVEKATASLKADLDQRDETIRRQAEEIERLTEAADGKGSETEPAKYEVGPFVSKVCQEYGIENFSDLQIVLDAIEAAFEPFAAFDPDGNLKPGGANESGGAEEGGDGGQTPPASGSEGGAETEGDKKDHFDDMDDDALRAFIKAQTGKDPHPASKRPTLLKKAREADQEAV